MTCTATGTTTVPLLASVTLTGKGGPSGRRLTDAAYALRYQLYLDPSRTIPWGDGSGGGSTATVSGVISPAIPFHQVLTVYGRILARQAGARAGIYTDQITAVLNY